MQGVVSDEQGGWGNRSESPAKCLLFSQFPAVTCSLKPTQLLLGAQIDQAFICRIKHPDIIAVCRIQTDPVVGNYRQRLLGMTKNLLHSGIKSDLLPERIKPEDAAIRCITATGHRNIKQRA